MRVATHRRAPAAAALLALSLILSAGPSSAQQGVAQGSDSVATGMHYNGIPQKIGAQRSSFAEQPPPGGGNGGAPALTGYYEEQATLRTDWYQFIYWAVLAAVVAIAYVGLRRARREGVPPA